MIYKKFLKQFVDWLLGKDEITWEYKETSCQCPICSYHRFEYSNGMANEPDPPLHKNCPEKVDKNSKTT